MITLVDELIGDTLICPVRLLLISCRLISDESFRRNLFSSLPLRRKLLMYFQSLPPTEQSSMLIEFPEFSTYDKPVSVIGLERVSACLKPLLAQKFQNLSESRIWSLQQDFYSTAHLKAWDDVPHEISSNRFVSALYSSHIRDMALKKGLNRPRVCIVELGAGHGILSYYLSVDIQQVIRFFLPF
jgi:hypothetical protein